MTMLQLAGPPAATAFRLEKLRAELSAAVESVTDVAAHFEHFVHLERPLDCDEQRVLTALLDYGGGAAPRTSGRQRLYVIPRLGTMGDAAAPPEGPPALEPPGLPELPPPPPKLEVTTVTGLYVYA